MTYTSLKIKRRKTTLVGKQSSLFIQLIRHRRIRRISLDIWIYEDEWLPFEEKLRPTEKTGCHHYRSLRNSLAAFIKTKKTQKTDLAFNELTGQLIADYEQFLLGKKLMPNTVSFYLRLLRSVWNKAAEDKLVEHHGSLFRHVNTRIEKTKKRAVSPAVINIYPMATNGYTTTYAIQIDDTAQAHASVTIDPNIIFTNKAKTVE